MPPLPKGDEAGANSLAAFEGVVLSIAGTDFSGILRVKRGLSGNIIGFALGTGTEAVIIKPGMLLETPDRKVLTIGSLGTSQTPLLTDIASTRSLSLTAPSGPSAPAFASTRAGAEFDVQAAADAAKLLADAKAASDIADREFLEEQNRLAEEAALKRGRLSTLTDLIQSFVASQAQARDTLANLQPDPFRFAAVAGGIAPFGTTPQQGFTQQLQDFASAPVPTADPNASLPSIESAIQGLTGANVPLSPQVFGAAGGATIPAPAPGQSINVKVGEKRPDGGSEEILRITAQGVEVIPIMAAAQEGGFFPFKPIEFDKESLFPALQTSGIFGSLGINQLPITQRGSAEGEIFGTGFAGAATFNRLGTPPRLVRDSDTSSLFLIENGVHRPISPEAFAASGFKRSDIVNLSHAGVLQLAPQRGAPIPAVLGGGQPESTDAVSPFTRFSAPIIEPTTGTALPAPFMVAEQLNRLRVTRPFMFNLLLSAYKSAGVPVEALLGGIQSSLSFGQERGSVGLR